MEFETRRMKKYTSTYMIKFCDIFARFANIYTIV